jgi:hypothetical protein
LRENFEKNINQKKKAKKEEAGKLAEQIVKEEKTVHV